MLEAKKSAPMAPDDNLLMEEVRDGKVERLAILFERHQVVLFNFFLRLTGNRSASEDLVQDVFMRILKYRHGYRSQSKFSVWMYQIARNSHIDYLRKQKGEVPLDEQWTEALSEEPAPEKQLEVDDETRLMRQALGLLPVKKREILVLSRFQNLKLREIADLLGCRVGTVKAQVHRALKDLGKIYFELSGGRTS